MSSSEPLPIIEGTDPSKCILDAFRTAIAVIVSKALDISLETAYSGVDLGKKGVDFTVAVPRFRLKAKPQELGAKIAAEFQPSEYLEKITVDGVFVHFYLNSKTLVRRGLDQIWALNKDGSYGTNESGKGKKVIVEFSSPNIAKPFHAGHLRSTILGAVLANLYKANGWDVVKMNYLGDWGIQFGLLAVGFRKYGSEEKLKENAIMHLFDVYVQVNKDKKAEDESGQKTTMLEASAIFRSMEDGDEENLALWRRFRDLSIEAYKKVYKRLNVEFDVFAGESLVTPDNIKQSVAELKEKGLLVPKPFWESIVGRDYKQGPPLDKDGKPVVDENPAMAVDLNKWKLDKPVIQKPDGTTIYIVRDIAGAVQRYNTYHFDKMVYVIGDQQNLHCGQFFKILSLMGYEFANNIEHINFGKVAGMSTRKGEVKFLEDILDTSKEAMFEVMQTNAEKFSNVEDPEYTSDQIGMTCVKIQDMTAKRINSYPFDVTRMTSFEGDTGAYLQYAHARLSSVERKVASEITLPEDSTSIDTDVLTEPKAREIVFVLATYPDVVRTALRNSEPSTVVSFCFRLSHLISSAWETLVVKGQEKELAQARLLLFVSARVVLASAMRLLSLTPLERM